MGCCGHKRAALFQGNVDGDAKPGEAGAAGRSADVRVALTRRRELVVRGPVTGRSYTFHEGATVQPVDPSDAPSLIMTGYFRPA
jgi:hypothetical protein